MCKAVFEALTTSGFLCQFFLSQCSGTKGLAVVRDRVCLISHVYLAIVCEVSLFLFGFDVLHD